MKTPIILIATLLTLFTVRAKVFGVPNSVSVLPFPPLRQSPARYQQSYPRRRPRKKPKSSPQINAGKSLLLLYTWMIDMGKTEREAIKRSKEITQTYLQFLDKHIADVVSGNASDFMEINQIASELFLSHKHLTDTVQKETGNHPCHFYDLKIIDQAKQMLSETGLSISEIARILTYDPSNFSKFFKKFSGQTPGQFRKGHKT